MSIADENKGEVIGLPDVENVSPAKIQTDDERSRMEANCPSVLSFYANPLVDIDDEHLRTPEASKKAKL